MAESIFLVANGGCVFIGEGGAIAFTCLTISADVLPLLFTTVPCKMVYHQYIPLHCVCAWVMKEGRAWEQVMLTRLRHLPCMSPSDA